MPEARVDAADAVQVVTSQVLAQVPRWPGWQGVIEVVKMTDREPNEVRAEVFAVIELTKDHIVSGVDKLDLYDDGLDSEILES